MNSGIENKRPSRVDKLLANKNYSPDKLNRLRFFLGLLEPDNDVDDDLLDDEVSPDEHDATRQVDAHNEDTQRRICQECDAMKPNCCLCRAVTNNTVIFDKATIAVISKQLDIYLLGLEEQRALITEIKNLLDRELNKHVGSKGGLLY